MAELADTTHEQVRRLESGQRRLTIEWMERFSKALGVRVTDLITEAPETTPAGNPYDADLMRRLGSAVFRAQQKHQIPISADDMGDLIVELYTEIMEGRSQNKDDGGISPSTLETMARALMRNRSKQAPP
jgi:transcriptional regulator with XRE-family HTH domain